MDPSQETLRTEDEFSSRREKKTEGPRQMTRFLFALAPLVAFSLYGNRGLSFRGHRLPRFLHHVTHPFFQPAHR
jgi:hypothetical protein